MQYKTLYYSTGIVQHALALPSFYSFAAPSSVGFIIPLCTLDMMAVATNMSYVFFFNNQDNAAGFMDSHILKQALYRTLAQFPILLGHLQKGRKGRVKVVVDRENINVPIYRETTWSQTHYTELLESQFDFKLWPEHLMPADSCLRPDPHTRDIKLLSISIMRLKSNSGVAVCISIPHYVMDGCGYFEFVNQWSDEAKAIVEGTCAPKREFLFDRSVVDRYLPPERAALPALVDSLYATRSPFFEYVARLPPVWRARFVIYMRRKETIRGCLFRMSRDKLDYLHQLVRPHLPEGMRISDNDLLIALFSMVAGYAMLGDAKEVMQLRRAADNPTRGLLGEQLMCLPCNFRSRIGMSDICYTGNMQYPIGFINPIEHLLKPITGESLAEVAAKARLAVKDVTAGTVASFVETINSQPTSYARPVGNTKHFAQILVVTNHMTQKIYETDFGYGMPDIGILSPVFAPAVNFIVPCKPPSADVYLHMTYDLKVMERIIENRFWQSLVHQIY
ncbi:hypothetical protein DL89DRAFT_274761 [Linderina pennispora]|uniref:Transferase n=1 Tax=Linderina pennispora TaxID=61395 RepID=A0A1Y1W8M9_9FUNG|nr:uncharacterized protein DL89DRAFT_274761 [Linderina pennispora]ORX69863.1 hypothetical protein DL89DRAFT_274761 [Linderina pennispora]